MSPVVIHAGPENFSNHGRWEKSGISFRKEDEEEEEKTHSHVSFSFLRAKCLMSAQQLAAEIKALFRDGL